MENRNKTPSWRERYEERRKLVASFFAVRRKRAATKDGTTAEGVAKGAFPVAARK